MDRLVRLAPALLAVGLCLALTLAFPAFVWNDLLQPVAVSLWLVWRLITSVDQSTYWSLLVLVCCVWLVRVLPPRREAERKSRRLPRGQGIPSIERWKAQLRAASASSEGTAALRDSLRELLAAVLSDGETSEEADLERRLAEAQLHVPARVRNYLFPRIDKRGRLARMVSGIAGWWHRRPGAEQAQDEAAAEVITWMENMMEMKHES